jgi:hypothetical protein
MTYHVPLIFPLSPVQAPAGGNVREAYRPAEATQIVARASGNFLFFSPHAVGAQPIVETFVWRPPVFVPRGYRCCQSMCFSLLVPLGPLWARLLAPLVPVGPRALTLIINY